MEDRKCFQCGKSLIKRSQSRFCSNQCQADYRYDNFIQAWLKGSKDGNRGINTRNISKHLRRYLISKYKEKCSSCGWDKKHTMTKRVPLEVDHIDGNAENNSEHNLQLLCPNCHSLTSSFRNLNKGKGRKWRKV